MTTQTRAHPLARSLASVVLGVLLLGYVLDALYLRRFPDATAEVYKGLLVASLALATIFGSLFLVTWVQRQTLWRTWAILLVATAIITAIGIGGHRWAQPREVVPEESTPPEVLLINRSRGAITPPAFVSS